MKREGTLTEIINLDNLRWLQNVLDQYYRKLTQMHNEITGVNENVRFIHSGPSRIYMDN